MDPPKAILKFNNSLRKKSWWKSFEQNQDKCRMNQSSPGQDIQDVDKLLNALIVQLGLRNDASLARTLEVGAPMISKLRHGKVPVGAGLLIRMMEVSGISIKELRALMGDRREKFVSQTSGTGRGKSQANQSAGLV
jgi:hypothetical protein